MRSDIYHSCSGTSSDDGALLSQAVVVPVPDQIADEHDVKAGIKIVEGKKV